MSDDPSCMSMITRYRDQRQCTALVPFFGQGSEGAQAWLRMHTSERRRITMRAAREKDYGTLWSLTEAWLRTFSVAGATIAKKTIANHRLGVRRLLEAWAQEDLLKPDPDAASFYISQMERDGLRPGTIQTRVAAARHLYAALRWARDDDRPLRGLPCATRSDVALGQANALRQRRARGPAPSDH